MANSSRKAKKIKPNNSSCSPKERSMGRLIVWNVTKAIEKNPQLNLKDALRETSFKLENKLTNVNLGTKHENSEERYLACAVLAWQQLGHASADSLYSFVESKKPPRSSSAELMCQVAKHKSEKRKVQEAPYNYDRSLICRPMCKGNLDVGQTGSEGFIAKGAEIAKSPESLPPAAVTEVSKKGYGCMRGEGNAGPVVRLPTTCVMRMETAPNLASKKTNDERTESLTASTAPPDVEMTCCLEPTCMDRLRELDAMTQELRERSAKLAKREAERVELLERAESSWRNVEQGYQRRLKLAEDGELDLLKQVKYGIDERNAYKNQCTQMATTLREGAEYVEKMRVTLKELDQQLCDRANKRMHLSQELTKVSTTLSDAHSKAWQLDRELQFKEEQAQRKLATMESEINSARALTIETERALRSQLSTLRSQINSISKQLLTEDERYKQSNKIVEDLTAEKTKLVISLETCKQKCDCTIKEAETLLKKKTEEYNEISAKVPTCMCQNPVEVGIHVKRTPSLAAMCACDPELGMADECSCKVMPSTLLSNMLAGLFAGLRDEVATIGINMPCPLLKCLDDRHSWESATPAKAAIKAFFTNLLVGELEVAIATSIENHHARWVGTTCADEKAALVESKDWQDKVIEKKAQKLATKLAEQLFNEKADKLAEKAQEIMKAGPPSCECEQPSKDGPAIYSCMVSSPAKLQGHAREQLREAPPKQKAKETSTNNTRLWKQTQQDVTQLKAQLESLKKAAINKGDLKHMEEKITRAVKSVTVNGKTNHSLPLKESARATNTEHKRIYDTDKKSKKHVDSSGSSKRQFQAGSKKHTQAYAVNLCFCESDQDPKKILSGKSRLSNESQKSSNWKQKPSNRMVRPLDLSTHEELLETDSQKHDCVNCNCFNREPSNTSINKLLDTLAKWKGKLTHEQSIEEKVSSRTPETTLDKLGFPKELLVPIINKDDSNNQESKKTKQSIDKIVDSVRLSSNGKCCSQKNPDFAPQENNTVNATESELIGSINLEKSNEVGPQPKNKDDQNTKENSQIKSVIKYNGNLCTTKGKQPSEIMQQQVIDESIQISDSIINGKKNSCECTSNETNSCSDYEIKLLGVTLTECDTQPVLKEKYKKNDELELYLKNEKGISKEKGKNYKEKGLDVLSTNETSRTTDCICCQENNTTEDLEINTFSLIEEFLKKRLEEFKDKSCVSKCLTKDEENKLFSDMLKNIKTTISKTVKNTKCSSCTESKDEDDNFRRGYCLLQEYLKLKLKRIQCVCPDKEEKDYLVADIYDKICSQIEHDFQRLKNVYSCNRKNINFEQPEKDTNSKENNIQKESGCNTSKTMDFKCKQNKDTSEMLNKIVNVPSVKSHISSKNYVSENSTELTKSLPKQNKICSCKGDSNTSGEVDASSKVNQVNCTCCNTSVCTASTETSKSFNSLYTCGTSSINTNISRKEAILGHNDTKNKENENSSQNLRDSFTQPTENRDSENTLKAPPTGYEFTSNKLYTKKSKNKKMCQVKTKSPTNTLEQFSTQSTNSSVSEGKTNADSEKEENYAFKDTHTECITICTCTENKDKTFISKCSCDESCGCCSGKLDKNKEIKEDNLKNINFNNKNNKSERFLIDNCCSCNIPCNCGNFTHKESNTVENNAWPSQFCSYVPQLFKLPQSLQAPFVITDNNLKNESKKIASIPIPLVHHNTDGLQQEIKSSNELEFQIPTENGSNIIQINSNLKKKIETNFLQANTESIEDSGTKIKIETVPLKKEIQKEESTSINEMESRVSTVNTVSEACGDSCSCDLIEEPEVNIFEETMKITNDTHVLQIQTKLTSEPVKKNGLQTVPENNGNGMEENKSDNETDLTVPTTPYIGYTMDCSSKLYGGSCSCYQSLPNEVSDVVQNLWSSSLNKQPRLSNFSYIMEKVKNHENDFNDCVCSSETFSPTTDENDIEAPKVHFHEAQVNTTQSNNEIVLKVSEKSLPEACMISKTDNDDALSENWYECCSNRSRKTSDPYDDISDTNNSKVLGHYRAESIGAPMDTCDCGMVPVCHVKLLMKSLEIKLDSGKCTCDALKSSVCPIHSTKN